MMPLDICAAGCITPIGASLAETAASARARLANLRDGPWQNRQGEPHVVGRVPDGVLPGLAEALLAANLYGLGAAVGVWCRCDDPGVNGLVVAADCVNAAPHKHLHGDGFRGGRGWCGYCVHCFFLWISACNSGHARPDEPPAGSTFFGSPITLISSTRSAALTPVCCWAAWKYLP